MKIDHIILDVNNRDESLNFYTQILGLAHEGKREVFEVVRVDENFVIQLAPFGAGASRHLAFSLDTDAFESTFGRIRAAGIEYGDTWNQPTNMKGPGLSGGAHGDTASVYCHDPSGHLIEILHYPSAS